MRPFSRGYKESGGPPLTDLLGSVLGRIARTATDVVVVVLVLRIMGVL